MIFDEVIIPKSIGNISLHWKSDSTYLDFWQSDFQSSFWPSDFQCSDLSNILFDVLTLLCSDFRSSDPISIFVPKFPDRTLHSLMQRGGKHSLDRISLDLFTWSKVSVKFGTWSKVAFFTWSNFLRLDLISLG